MSRRTSSSKHKWLFRVLVVLTLALFLANVYNTRLVVPVGQASPQAFSQTVPQIPRVAQRQTVLGYDRANFGASWAPAQVENHSCTTRTRELVSEFPDAHVGDKCQVAAGGTIDPYSGEPLYVDQTEIDHVFPLAAAWDLGAAWWDDERRLEFANDPENLLAVSKTENRAKGDRLPSEWLPSALKYRCFYARQLAQVAAKYQLALTNADLTVLARACGLPFMIW